MKLILDEMKKMFNFKKIVILLVINVLLFYTCIDKHISGLKMNSYFSGEHSIMADFIKRNGSTMREDNLRIIESIHNDDLEKINKIINENQEFKGVGINNYNDLSRAEYDKENFDTNKVKNLKKKYLENTDVYNEFCVLGNCIGKYHISSGNIHIADVNREDRIKEIQANKSYESILPFCIFDTDNDIIGNLGICSVICVVIILLPLLELIRVVIVMAYQNIKLLLVFYHHL